MGPSCKSLEISGGDKNRATKRVGLKGKERIAHRSNKSKKSRYRGKNNYGAAQRIYVKMGGDSDREEY